MKTGIIKAIQPDGGYQSKNGYIYQSQMTIEFEGEGQQTGEIGSKSDPYPANVGEEINVEIKIDQRARTGYKYKKINPQYPQGGSQGSGQPTGGQNSQGRDYDAENRGKCRTQFIKAILINSGMFTMDADSKVYIDGLVHYSMTGVIPPQQQGAKYAGNSVPDEDVPF